jgi:lysophospholipase L1-like esterase
MKPAARILCFFVLLASTRSVAGAEDAKPKAVTPEVQTASWAVKWWGPRHEQKLKDLKAQKKVDLLMIGDSITHGWEGAGKKVWNEFYAKRNAFNIGYSGDRTEQVIWRLQHGEVEGISPKLAVIMIGTNNTGHRQDPPKETAAGIRLIIDELKKRTPKTKILLLAIFPRGAKADDKLRRINDGTNAIIKDYADDKTVCFLDINKTFLDDDGTLPKSVMPDLLHPREDGYRMWAEAMEPSIRKLLGE